MGTGGGRLWEEPSGVGAKWCVFLVFHLLPTTVTVYVRASHCGVTYLNLFCYFVACRILNSFPQYNILAQNWHTLLVNYQFTV